MRHLHHLSRRPTTRPGPVLELESVPVHFVQKRPDLRDAARGVYEYAALHAGYCRRRKLIRRSSCRRDNEGRDSQASANYYTDVNRANGGLHLLSADSRKNNQPKTLNHKMPRADADTLSSKVPWGYSSTSRHHSLTCFLVLNELLTHSLISLNQMNQLTNPNGLLT